MLIIYLLKLLRSCIQSIVAFKLHDNFIAFQGDAYFTLPTPYSTEIRNAAAVANGANTRASTEHAASNERCACALMPC
jgi:hypothetical protein